MVDCCKLVGNLSIGGEGCYISASTSCSTEITNACGDETPLCGPTTQSVTLAGYASDTIHVGCPGRAGVSISWIKKYDCVNNKVYFLFAGQGQSYVAGDVGGLASISHTVDAPSSDAFSAGSSSGPASVYMETSQENGYGLNYTGGPISFTTSKEGTTINLSIGNISGLFYLQSFGLDMQPGQMPVANYTFIRGLES
jgi:hypothetical protein